MSQVASDISGQAEAQGDAQGGAQAAEQQAQGPAAGGQQQQAPAAGDELGVRVAYDNFANLGHGRDFNKVIHDAQSFQALQRDGYVGLAEQASAQGLTGHGLIDRFRSMGAGPQQAQQAAQEVQQVQQQAQQGVQQGVFTREQAQEFVRQEMQAFKDEFEQQRTSDSEQAEFERLTKIEESTYVEILGGMGYTAKPGNVTIAGADIELDAHFEIMRSALKDMTQRVIDQGLSPSDPQYAAKRLQPATRAQIDQAAQFLGPFLKTMAQQAMEQAADAQEQIPSGALGTGAGGRAEDDSQPPQTVEEIRKQVTAKLTDQGKIGANRKG